MKKMISVITVCYNAEACIKATLQSMEKQGKGEWEYIVIDGGSQDNTLKIINSFKGLVDALIVESDHGIYDAMNKGLALAKGRYVYFLNAGDSFYRSKVLSEIVLIGKSTQALIIFGDLKTSVQHIKTQRLLNKSYRGIPHQACFFEREKIDLFDLKYKVCADFKQYIQAKNQPEFSSFHVPFIIANYDSIKPDKSEAQRLQYDIARTTEKMKICFACLRGYKKIIGTTFYFLHFIKYRLGLNRKRNISEN